MRINFICSALGIILRLFALMLLLPCLVAIIEKDYFSILPFVVASGVSLFLGFLLKINQESLDSLNLIKKTEVLFTVALSWVSICLISAVPYLFYNFSPLNALFEATSGITTTGATILTTFDYPRAMFLWRSLSQWLGGMGIIVLFIAILPQFRIAGRQMFYAEAPGPTEDKVTPRIKHTAIALWGVYVFLTLLQIILYKLAGMNVFDAICNAFSTISAGGFSPNANSIMGYNSSLITWITILFMFLSGANFALQYRVYVQRKFESLIKSDEFKLYFGFFIGISMIIAIMLSIENFCPKVIAIRDAMFQTISTMTSTGFATVDYIKWGLSTKIFLFLAMFIGGCAGSAAGGMKVVRVLYMFKFLKTEITKILHPNAVIPIKIDKTIVSDEVGKQIVSFVMFYFLIFAIGAVLVSLIEQNVVIGISGSISAIGNIGPAFGALGPFSTFDVLHPATKCIFILMMLVGRLELIPFLAMFHVDFWKIR